MCSYKQKSIRLLVEFHYRGNLMKVASPTFILRDTNRLYILRHDLRIRNVLMCARLDRIRSISRQKKELTNNNTNAKITVMYKFLVMKSMRYKLINNEVLCNDGCHLLKKLISLDHICWWLLLFLLSIVFYSHSSERNEASFFFY